MAPDLFCDGAEFDPERQSALGRQRTSLGT
jgi:hypothetical protein